MRPAVILAVVNELALRDRVSVVECGSGNSTVYFARLMSQHGLEGHVNSLEHDARWATLTRQALTREGLDAWATVTHAPLVDGWYDEGALPDGEVDVLVVDGPPAHAPSLQRSRERALDVFRSRLADNATVVLDDAHRPGEREVIVRWRQRHGIALEQRPGGYAIATLGGRPQRAG